MKNKNHRVEIGKSKHQSVHHIVPTSRGGPKEEWNEYHWNIKKHRAWHALTHNYLPSEAITLIRSWTLSDGQLDKNKMGRGFYLEWRRVFGDWTSQQAIRCIEQRFLPVETRFLQRKKHF